MPYKISKWKTKSRISRASFKYEKKTKLSEFSSNIETVTYGLRVSGAKSVAKLERLVKRLNKHQVDPEDMDLINHHLDIVNSIKASKADMDKFFKP